MRELIYNRQNVIDYAQRWALSRNPQYYDFEDIGGDCTNFASQCIYAGAKKMNYSAVYGWYYIKSSRRTASWTGVQYLYNFLTTNKGAGPYAVEVDIADCEPGDILQLGNSHGEFYHTPVIVAKEGGEIFVAAHTFDTYMRSLDSYIYDKVRFLHIAGVRSS